MREKLIVVLWEQKLRKKTGFDFLADRLIPYIVEKFDRLVDNRNLPDAEIPLVDALQAAYAMFALMSSSVLGFDKEKNANSNLRNIFNLKKIPLDTRMPPPILLLQRLKLRFIIGAKKSDHNYLFQQSQEARERNE